MLLEASISNWFYLYNIFLIVYLTNLSLLKSTTKYTSRTIDHMYILVPVPKPVPVPKGVFVEDPNISKANEHNLS